MKINFIVTDSFLRTKAKTDPFYDPIIKAIDGRPDIECKIFVSHKGIACGYPAERLDDFKALDVCSVWFYRFCRLIAWRVPSWKIYQWFGWLARPFFARKFNTDVVVTQAGQFADVFATLLPNARVADIQHGVIHSRHRGYFDLTGRLLPIYRGMKMREFWLFGQGYADCFFKHPDNANDLQGRVKVIGDVIRAGEKVGVDSWSGRDEVRDMVVIASQMTPDFSSDVLKQLKSIYENAFNSARGYGKVVFRHHPRFGNCIDLNDWAEKYPWVVVDDDRSWPDVFAESCCLLTINSTSAFDAAAYGVPTVLLDGSVAGFSNMMVDEYGYPFAEMTVGQYCNMDDVQQSSVKGKVRKWYERFYSPFTEENCMRLLKGN